MKELLYVKNYYKPVFLETKPEDKSEDEWKIAHLQACDFIRQWVDDNVLNHICDVEDALCLWKKLEELYALMEGVNEMLIKKLMHLKYKEGSTVFDHINFQGVIN